MKWILDREQMACVDTYSIQKMQIPSLVLMERAALAVTQRVLQKITKDTKTKVLCVCGCGNNGADGIAVARQLHLKGVSVDIVLAGDEAKATNEFHIQLAAAKNLGISISHEAVYTEYNCIVDAIFGIGLKREVQGVYAETINSVNANKEAFVVAVDVPSGISSDTGAIMGTAVHADATVTFGYLKRGLVLYPGRQMAGDVTVADPGFASFHIEKENYAFTFEREDIKRCYQRNAEGNKGTFGKVLIIAGSKQMAGAAVMSALGAFRTGCGLVKIITHTNNRDVILQTVPEAIVVTYDENDALLECLQENLAWADVLVVGPGISQSEQASQMVFEVLHMEYKKELPCILDADALNILAQHTGWLLSKTKQLRCIVTPHIGEFVRLTNKTADEVKADACRYAKAFAEQYGVICVLKDAVTVVSDGEQIYINSSGNEGMATAGSGDVLTGILAGVLANTPGHNLLCQVGLGVYLHGLAGDASAKIYGRAGMKATDIALGAALVLKDLYK